MMKFDKIEYPKSGMRSFVCLVYFVRLSNVFSLFSFIPGPVVVKRYCDGSNKPRVASPPLLTTSPSFPSTPLESYQEVPSIHHQFIIKTIKVIIHRPVTAGLHTSHQHLHDHAVHVVVSEGGGEWLAGPRELSCL